MNTRAFLRNLSENEEDSQHFPDFIAFGSENQMRRKISTDDKENESAASTSAFEKARTEFKDLATYVERDLSNSESEDDKEADLILANLLSKNKITDECIKVRVGVGMKLLDKMGLKFDTGPQKYEGEIDIVHLARLRDRSDLDLYIPKLDPSDSAIWDDGIDKVFVPEPIEWIPECKSRTLSLEILREMVEKGKKKTSIADETEFCHPDILQKILSYKSVFDQLEPEKLRKAKIRANPFELIDGAIFLNRDAMKMANMDSAFDYMFTNPKSQRGNSLVAENELLYFADICGGPGGFSEYILWRKRWGSKGFGFTLKGPNDFKLEDFFAGPPETFEPYYGAHGDGNIYDSENIQEFQKFVLNNTDGKGVHFVMADGGFSVDGMENVQEILSKRLYLCQFLCALSILRTDGHFVCKLFDLFTPFSVGLIYLMYNAFEKICIFKPNTSNPANSERYLICKWLKPDIKNICIYMYAVNGVMDKYFGSSCDMDINEVVPLHILKKTHDFYEYIVDSNNVLGANQIIHLDKIRAFAENPELEDYRQGDLKKKCLELWKIPDKPRSAPVRPDAEYRFKQLMFGESLTNLWIPPGPLNESSITNLKSVFDIHCIVSGETSSQKATLFLGLGRSNVYSWDKNSDKWFKVEPTFELPADTLFYGELITEYNSEKSQECLHIIDAICLGGQDVRKKYFPVRLKLAEKLTKAISKSSKQNYTPLKVKEVFNLRNIEKVFNNLSLRMINYSHVRRLCYDLTGSNYYRATGLLMFRTTKNPWVTAYSKTSKQRYFFNIQDKESRFERVDAANADFMTCFKTRILWTWQPGIYLIPDQKCDESKKTLIHSHTIKAFVKKNLNRILGLPPS